MVIMAGNFALFCFLLGVFLTEGIKFSHPEYIVVLTAGSDKGPVAKITVEESASDITYGLEGVEGPQLLDVNNRGTLSLLKKLDETVAAEFKNKKFKLKGKLTNGQTAFAFVKIVVLPSCYGDKFVPLVKMEQDSVVKGSLFTKITSRALLRFLRKPSETGRKIALAQLKLQRKIAKIKSMIAQEIAGEHGSDALIKFYLHIKALFCMEMMEEMDKETECIEPVKASSCSCPLNPRFSTIDGTCNNIYRPTEGASNTGFIRLLPPLYFDVDGLNDPIGYPDQPNAPSVPNPLKISRRFIRDEIAASSQSSTLTHAVMQFGQFIDHDLDLAVEVEFEGNNICLDVPCDGSSEDFTCPCYPILPDGDAPCIRVTRSAAVCQEHGYPKPREQINVNTAPIDASQVYGSTERVAEELRETEPEDRGLLKSLPGRDGEILPLDPSLESEEQLCINEGGCFIAGDSRSNEQMSLAAFHSLFLREHNRIARDLKRINNHWTGEIVYQETRRIMAAVMQKITYVDFLPTILGPNALPEYKGYKPCVNLGISNVFATAAFRFGHSLIRPSFDILNKNFDPIGDPIELRFMFFNNTFIQRNGIQPLLLGLIGNFSEKVDRTLSAGVTQHLFERENSPGSNLAALNIQRHRDHGLPGYNDFRVFCGLENATTFADTRKEISLTNIKILKELYGDNPNLVEVWVAGLAETPVKRASVGPTFHCIIKDQFQRTRDGDQFYYERGGVWPPDQLKQLKKASLSRMYCDNLNITSIQRNAFRAPTDRRPRINCNRIPNMDLCFWKECFYGVSKPIVLNGKSVECKCTCRRPWHGERCDSKLARRASWHVIVKNALKKVVCSGAFVRKSSKINRPHILTTTSCAKDASKDGFVVLGYPARIRKIKSFGTLGNNGLAFIELDSTVGITGAITFAAAKPRGLGFVSVRSCISTSYLVRSDVSGSSKVCKNVFKVFDPLRDICTLPASLPAGRRGSPLVQYVRSIPYLVGILTGDAKSSSSKLRFGKYAKVW